MVSLIFLPVLAATETAEAAGGIGALGVDVRALLFQVVNFTLLLFLLKRFAYKPVLKILAERRKRVEESLRAAHELEAAKNELVVERERILQDAHVGAQRIVDLSKEQAATLLQEAREVAQARATQIVEEGTARIAHEEARLRQALLGEIRVLVREATTRLLGRHFAAADDEELISRTIEEVRQ